MQKHEQRILGHLQAGEPIAEAVHDLATKAFLAGAFFGATITLTLWLFAA